MKVIITGAAGFLGKKLAIALLENEIPIKFDKLLLIDVHPVCLDKSDSRVLCIDGDFGDIKVLNSIIDADCNVIFHLAAVVSGQAEVDFDLGMKVNFDSTRQLLEVVRYRAPNVKLIFTSTCGVFGGRQPPLIDDYTAVTPENSYGMEKSLCELLINDYTRRGYVDGRVIRLPTVTVREGKPNKAVTSFVSGMVREPLNGIKCVIPVSEDLPIWVCSPRTVIKNIIHAAVMKSELLGSWRVVNLPGITVTVKEIVDSLKVVAGPNIVSLLSYETDEAINKILVSFPRYYDTTRAINLGFQVDENFVEIIRAYVNDNKIYLHYTMFYL